MIKSSKKAALSQERINASLLTILSQQYLATGILRVNTGECLIQANNSDVSLQLQEYINAGNLYDDVAEKYINDFVYVEDQVATRNTLSRNNLIQELKKHDRIDFVVRRHSDDGLVKFTRVEITVIPDTEDSPEYLFTFKDIDDQVHQDMMQREQLQKAYLEAERASRAKNEFMHNMSHDIRTPLNAILGYTTIASDHTDDPAAMRDYLSKIFTSSQNLIHIVNEILDLDELKSGNIKLSETTLTMRSLINHVVEHISPAASDKKQNFHVYMDSRDNTPLSFDSLHVEKVLTNLLSNAVKFTENGGTINLTIESSASTIPNNMHYRFIIEDNGIGISEDFLDRIFDPYSRERTSTMSRNEGIGVGLTITKNIVDALHGKIGVKSVVDVGTTFTIDLDFVIASQTKKAPQIEKTSSTLSSISGKRILVVDDSKVNRDIATAILEGLNAKVETASDGDIAVSMYQASKTGYYNMILMDIQMPQMDGFEATKAIRRFNRDDAARIPIIALTADVFDSTKRSALECGMNDFLTKPINVNSLTSTLIDYFA